MSAKLGRRGFLATTAALAAPRIAASAEQRVGVRIDKSRKGDVWGAVKRIRVRLESIREI